jgi:hypothetical protein
MSDEALTFEYRISRKSSFALAFYSACLIVVAVLCFFWFDHGFAVLHGAGAIVLARWSARGFWASRHWPWHVRLMEDRIVVPSVFAVLRVSNRTVKFEKLTSVLFWKCTDHRRIALRGKGMEVDVQPGLFASDEDFETFQSALTQRLEAHGVPIERREFRFSRPQFSLLHLLLLTTVVAVGFSLLAFLEIPLTVGLLPFLTIIGFWIVMDAIPYGPWWMRAFGLGVLLGSIAEIAALMLLMDWRFLVAPAVGGTGGLYPFTRLFWPESPLANHGSAGLILSVMSGLLVSGILFGGVAVGVSAAFRRRARRQGE